MTLVGVLGELLITAGVLVLLFLGWQLWFNSLVIGNEQQDRAQELSESFSGGDEVVAAPAERADPGDPDVGTAPAENETFGNLIVPRFGADWKRPIAEGIGRHTVLDNIGVGHYPGTQMPGEVGNFAVAAHRNSHGDAFVDINKLQLGDPVYVETEDGWYRYIYRSTEYVLPTGVGVLEPVPQMEGAAPTDRILTLTSCNPEHSISERIIAYTVYDTWYPREFGAPPEIADLVQNSAAG